MLQSFRGGDDKSSFVRKKYIIETLFLCSLFCACFCRFCVGIVVKRRSALGAMELGRLYIDIAALSEVRFAEQGSLGDDGAGVFWSGKNEDERRLSGAGFTIKTSIARKLQNFPVGHSDRFMSLRLTIQEQQVCHCPQCVRTYTAG